MSCETFLLFSEGRKHVIRNYAVKFIIHTASCSRNWRTSTQSLSSLFFLLCSVRNWENVGRLATVDGSSPLLSSHESWNEHASVVCGYLSFCACVDVFISLVLNCRDKNWQNFEVSFFNNLLMCKWSWIRPSF